MSSTCTERKIRKLVPHSELCLFVGYRKGTRGGLFYCLEEKKVFLSTNATFLENDYMMNFKPWSKVVIEDILSIEIIPQPTTFVKQKNEGSTSLGHNALPSHHSGRIIRLPTHYREDREALVAISDNDPLTYQNAMENLDKEK